jgi:ABC-2 type transport system ATP-binding protein
MSTPSVEVSHVAKSFGATEAVRDVSFAVQSGEIFGLLGPNGAGKTTTIRIILDLFKADHGVVSVLGGRMSEEKKGCIGYMPEERGLYPDMPLENCLVYLATLKGLSSAEARRRLKPQLEAFDLTQHRRKKVKELSKGMQQKAQIIATILHEPELIFVDEPFAALDPVNTQLVKDLMRGLRAKGVTIVMSTHQMHQVEELCDRIVLINKGSNLLYGNLTEVRRQYSGHAVLVRGAGALPTVAGVEQASPHNDAIKWTLAPGTTPQAVLKQLLAQDVVVEKFEIASPTLEEIFIRAVGEESQ